MESKPLSLGLDLTKAKKMKNFILEFHNNIQEVNDYFEFVKLIDNLSELAVPSQATYKIDRELQKVLKANCYLILYNLIEGSIRTGIEAIFLALSQQNLTYAQVNHPIKQIWLQYKYKVFKTGVSHAEVVDIIETIFDDIIKIDYDDYIEKNKHHDISGSLDVRKVRELADVYGFSPPTITCDSLGLIKHQRNRLAHGRISFSEAGKFNDIEELIDIKNDVIQYLDDVLSKIAAYINSEGYKSMIA